MGEAIWANLSSLGYNNYADLETSGEAHLIARLGAAGLSGRAFDVGAHDGSYSKHLIRHGFKQVVMIEPHPAHASVLTDLASRSGAVFMDVAASDESGSAQLHFDPTDLQLASLASDIEDLWFVRNREAVTVGTRTLDSIWADLGGKRLDLLKIDVEGWESEALLGARRMLAECPPRVIQIEMNQYHLVRGQSLLAMSRLIPRHYHCFQLLPGSHGARPVDVLDPLSNIYAFANFVFIDPDHRELLTR